MTTDRRVLSREGLRMVGAGVVLLAIPWGSPAAGEFVTGGRRASPASISGDDQDSRRKPRGQADRGTWGKSAGSRVAAASGPQGRNDAAPLRESKPRRKANRRIPMIVTAYCPCTRCCGESASGVTASGKSIWYNRSQFVAADERLPFFQRVRIPGYSDGAPVPVTDRGSAIKGNRIDVFFHSHEAAERWGVRRLMVEVLSR